MKRSVLAGSDVTAERNSKHVKTVVKSIADNWLCPIIQELMIDPVMAKEHPVYECTTIAKWFTTQQTSPNTGAVIGMTLFQS